MRSLAHFGGYVAGAYAADTAAGAYSGDTAAGAYSAVSLVGAAVGFVGDGFLHSHITGVAPSAQGHGVGYVLKRHQRAWALERGIATINWTFDPLVRRNAYFNLGRLGAAATEYLVDFYGDMSDGLNAGQGSDRLVATWSLEAAVPRAEPDIAALINEKRVTLNVDPAGAPRLEDVSGEGPLLCRVPPDIAALRVADPGLGRRWRLAVRTQVGGAMARGYRVTAATRFGWYVLEAP